MYTTTQKAFVEGTTALREHSASPRLDAELLLAHTLDETRAFLYGHPEHELTAIELARYQGALRRRQQGEPVAYIIGSSEFWSLPIMVNPACLVPRPETELLVERAVLRIPKGADWHILDLGTGSGALALAIAWERPRCTITAIDKSPAALEIARANASALNLNNVECLLGDWFTPVIFRHFNLIVSNPPYIAAGDPHLADEGVHFEPDSALKSGAEGMDALAHIADNAGAFLNRNGWLLLEHGYRQRGQVYHLLRSAGFKNLHCLDDFNGNPRVIEGRGPTSLRKNYLSH